MDNSEFLQETILKESAYGIAVAQTSEKNYFFKSHWTGGVYALQQSVSFSRVYCLDA